MRTLWYGVTTILKLHNKSKLLSRCARVTKIIATRKRISKTGYLANSSSFSTIRHDSIRNHSLMKRESTKCAYITSPLALKSDRPTSCRYSLHMLDFRILRRQTSICWQNIASTIYSISPINLSYHLERVMTPLGSKYQSLWIWIDLITVGRVSLSWTCLRHLVVSWEYSDGFLARSWLYGTSMHSTTSWSASCTRWEGPIIWKHQPWL